MTLEQSTIAERVNQLEQNINKTIDEALGIDTDKYREMIEARLVMDWETYDRLHAEFMEQLDIQPRREKLTAFPPSNLCQEICLPSSGPLSTCSLPWHVPVAKGPIAGIFIGDVL